ncbi:DUF3868 domain-containing protein [Parabacteroides sp. PF5-6]|uniref:DUF3868 domain-containing protein n=1 Tax=Parabacteroides sp. PF5-6 TaxID=1742403 RepID=UPI002404E76B|nr:DUF3868 domain-containing protein [Parabacteroides sp. PF5-6]MDF9831253.1 hypothetical protein [Parabacteroides sp. PF5-6]
MKRYYIYIIITLFWVVVATATAQQEAEPIRITDVVFKIDDDSLQLNCRIQLTGIEIKTYQSLELALAIEAGEKKALLPPIVYAGRLRHRYDERRRNLYGQINALKPYQVYTTVRKENVYTLDYQAKIPYGHWLDQAALTLQQTFESNGYVMKDKQVLSDNLRN